MAAPKRPADTDGNRPQKRVKRDPDTLDCSAEILPTPICSLGGGNSRNNRKGVDSFGSDTKTLLDDDYNYDYDSDATDYDTNATISERLWISDAEEGDDDWRDDQDWNKDHGQTGKTEKQQPWRHLSDSPGTEGGPSTPPSDDNNKNSSVPKDEYNTSVSSSADDDFFFGKWYWDESWYDYDYDSGDHFDDSHQAASVEVEVEPPSSSASNQALHEDLCQISLPPWSAPPEPFRPLHPYTKGLTLEIWRHEASPPFYQSHHQLDSSASGDLPQQQQQQRRSVSNQELRATTVVELCLNYPPLPGKTHTEEPPQRLTIVETIRAKDGEGAQLVVCRLDDGQDEREEEPKEYVAKIYDPFYYGFADPYWTDNDMPWDVATEVDRAYCAEVAAYTALQQKFDDTEQNELPLPIPRFHGAWTFQLPLDSPNGGTTSIMRDVRMILTERVPSGKRMADVRTDLLPETERLAAVRMVLEASARIASAGVHLPGLGVDGSVAPQNIVVCGLNERVSSRWSASSPCMPRRVAFVDLSRATVHTRRSSLEERRNSDGANATEQNFVCSPLQMEDWWEGGLYASGYGTWLVAGWDCRLRPMQEWLWGLYKDVDSNEYQYQAVEKTSLRWADEDERVHM